VDEGHTGLLVPVDERAFGQALGRLIDDRVLAKRLGTHARGVALSRYSSDRMVDAYLALYDASR
jgi:glycosyltransferase involved in cell wall biosynthesis